ncbi:MAG: hypothetical protein ABIG30_01785 [Candidatus Aenigmatarchaeota archaeon]
MPILKFYPEVDISDRAIMNGVTLMLTINIIPIWPNYTGTWGKEPDENCVAFQYVDAEKPSAHVLEFLRDHGRIEVQ